jgi:hypothetical protein
MNLTNWIMCYLGALALAMAQLQIFMALGVNPWGNRY